MRKWRMANIATIDLHRLLGEAVSVMRTARPASQPASPPRARRMANHVCALPLFVDLRFFVFLARSASRRCAIFTRVRVSFHNKRALVGMGLTALYFAYIALLRRLGAWRCTTTT